MPLCFAHLHTGIMGQAIGLAVIGQIGHFSMGQQLTGSVPTTTGAWPPGQANMGIGQAMGFAGSHGGGDGMHSLVQVCPVQFPEESHWQVASPPGHEQVLAVPPPALPPAEAQPQPTQIVLQCSPFGQSASVVQLVCCGSQVQGPPHGSVPAQTVVSPGLQVGLVHPQVGSAAAADGAGPPSQGHW